MTQSPSPSPVGSSESSVTFDVRSYVLLMHFAQFSGLVIPFGSIIAPLILWAMKRNISGQIDEQGKEILNFQISFAIWSVISFVLIFFLIGILVMPIVLVTELILVIVGIVKASNLQPYRYPLTIRFIT